MAKNTHAQEAATGTSDSYTDEESADPTPPLQVTITRPELGTVDKPAEPKEEAPSPTTEGGGVSTRSSQSESNVSDKPNQSPQQPAPTMENPSSPIPRADSDANSTDGDGPKTEQPPSDSKGRKTPAKKATTKAQPRSRATMMGAEDDFDEFN